MSAVLKSQAEYSLSDTTSSAAPKRRRLRVMAKVQPLKTVIFPPQTQSDRPLWLKLLIAGQRLSLGMAAVTVAGALSAYALTVDTNRKLTTVTASLGQLQDQEQQLTTAIAVFKNHLAQTAIDAVDSGALHPKDVIFLEAASPTPAAEPAQPASPEDLSTDKRFFPKGY